MQTGEREKLINRRRLEFAVWRKSFERAHRAWANAPADLKGALLLEGDGLGRAEFWLIDFADKFTESERQFIRSSLTARPLDQRDGATRFIHFARRNSTLVLAPALVILFFTGYQQIHGMLARYNQSLIESFDRAGLHRGRAATRNAAAEPAAAHDGTASLSHEGDEAPGDHSAIRHGDGVPGARRGGDELRPTAAPRPARPPAARTRRGAPQADPTLIAYEHQRRLIETAEARHAAGNRRVALLLSIEAARVAERLPLPSHGPYADLPAPATLLLRTLATPVGSLGRTLRADAPANVRPCANLEALVVADAPDALSIWPLARLADGPLRLEGSGTDLTGAALSRACDRLALGGDEYAVDVWALDGGGRIASHTGHEAPVLSARFTRDGTTLLTASQDHSVRVWHVGEPRPRLVLQDHDDAVSHVEISTDDRIAITASVDRTARVFDIATGRTLQTLRGHAGAVTGATLTADSRMALTTSTDGSAVLWDVATGRRMRTLRSARASILSARLSGDGGHVATVSDAGEVHLWQTTGAGDPIGVASEGGPVRSIAFTTSGRTLAVHYWNGLAALFNASTGARIAGIGGADSRVAALAFDGASDTILAIGEDGAVTRYPVPETLDTLIAEVRRAAGGCLTPEERTGLALDPTVPVWCTDDRLATVE